MPRSTFAMFAAFVVIALIAACAPTAATSQPSPSNLQVVAVETFLADIAQNVAGERVHVQVLMPLGVDAHAFEPTPQDVKKVADSDVFIVNGAGFEGFLDKLLENAGGTRLYIEASKGLVSRERKADEPHAEDTVGDPHFWFDPTKTIRYVENIRDGLTQADPAGAATYKSNADAYIQKLNALDTNIKDQVNAIPSANRKLVTDHDTFGYFADRYGFQIVGMIVPSVSTADSTSAQNLAELIQAIQATGAKAIFLEVNANPQVAEQIARETGARIVTGLYTHSVSEPNGPAPTYIQMLEYDTRKIVDALQ